MIFAKPGFAADVARHLGVTHQNVSAWKRVPAHHVQKLAPLIEMTPEQIRPDIFKGHK
jgi:DNA-binding transcriptional regulator YdaS (Cro superfamily)